MAACAQARPNGPAFGETLARVTPATAENDWLDYAWGVVNCSAEHRRGCVRHGASSGPGLDGLDDLCFPGYLGRDYRGLLCVAAVHRSPENVSDHEVRVGQSYRAAHTAWRRGRSPDADAAFLEWVRTYYEAEFESWGRWRLFSGLAEQVGLTVRHIAYANLAKCRQLRGATNEPLIKFCKQDFPMTRLVEAIRPEAVLVCVKHAGPGGSLGVHWRSGSCDPYVWAYQGLNRQAPDGRWQHEWEPEVIAELKRRLGSDRGGQDAVTNAKARAADAQRLTADEDDAVIATMNAKRVEEGKEPLSEQQEASVREQRRRRREKPA